MAGWEIQNILLDMGSDLHGYILILYMQYPINKKWSYKRRLVSRLNLRNALKKIKKPSLAKISWLRNNFVYFNQGKKVKFKYC